MANKTEELRELDINGLVHALAEAKDNSFKLRFKLAVGQLDNTYIVFTSDNGYLLGEHRYVGKIVAES